MNIKIFLLLPILTLTYAVHDNIFILSGQSNMVGLGGVFNFSTPWDGIVPAECAPDSSKIFRLNENLTWEVATEPLHRNIVFRNLTCGIGPGMPFANAVKSRVQGTIGLVPCAVGGTDIRQWQQGESLYKNMITRARVAVAGGGKIKALLWYQGESDSNSQEKVIHYEQRMVDLFTSVRRDLNLPHLPIIQVAIATGFKYIESIRKLQKGLRLDNVSCVDAKGLEINVGDRIHLTTAAQVRLGRMLAEEYVTKYLTPPQAALERETTV